MKLLSLIVCLIIVVTVLSSVYAVREVYDSVYLYSPETSIPEYSLCTVRNYPIPPIVQKPVEESVTEAETTSETTEKIVLKVETSVIIEEETQAETEELKTLMQVIEPTEEVLEVPSVDTSFKTFMDYRCITATGSNQYKFSEVCYTDEDGLRRYEDYYVVGLGTYYTQTVGDTFLVEFDTRSIKIIIGDVKQDIHTDPTNRYAEINGNMVEFVVDTKAISRKVLRAGDVSMLDMQGSIKSIKVIERCRDLTVFLQSDTIEK